MIAYYENLLLIFLSTFIFCVFSANLLLAQQKGDRSLQMNIVYPEDAFLHAEKGGRIIDVTKPPFNAKGDGKTDDTKALIAAYDFVAEKMRQPFWSENKSSYIIYLPNGTYLVSDTIIYSGHRIDYDGRGWAGITRVRFVGQSRENTIIRLKENCPGFEADANKPVLSYQKEHGTNVPAGNQCRNLTINTGKGNPGAIGLLFLGANMCGMNNVTIKSEDGLGYIGLDMPFFSVQGHFKDIKIEGFDYGIRVKPMAEMNPTLEYLTLRNQNKVGILVESGSPCIRRLFSYNSVSAIQITQKAAQVVIIDSTLEGDNKSVPAMHLKETSSQLFVRNVKVSGYGVSVRKGSENVLSGDVDEYVSGDVYTLFEGQQEKSLNLPVEDAPILQWEQNMNQWANVDEYPGDNDAERIQNAMNSGKTTVYFPSGYYDIIAAVEIPSTVVHIDFMYSYHNNGAKFIIAESSDTPLWIENWRGRALIEQQAPRTVIIRNVSSQYRNKQTEPTKLFLESCVNLGASTDFCRPNQKIWARSIDNEYKNTSNFKIVGGIIWVLGFKTEGHQPCFDVRDGGICEVLGGYRNETTPDEGFPMVINDNSNVSFVGYTSMSQIYENAVWEIRGNTTKKLMRADLPQRLGYKNDFYIPLYVGYDNAVKESD